MIEKRLTFFRLLIMLNADASIIAIFTSGSFLPFGLEVSGDSPLSLIAGIRFRRHEIPRTCLFESIA
jgi:hypothetical protein